MLPTSFVIYTSHEHYNNAAGVLPDTTFEKRSDDASSVQYAASVGTLGEPLLLTWAPKLAKPGAIGVDRHLLKLQDYAIDDTGKSHVMTMSIQSAIPRTAVFSQERVFRNLCLLMSPLQVFDQTSLTQGDVMTYDNLAFWSAFMRYSL